MSNWIKGCLYVITMFIAWAMVNGGVHTVEDIQCNQGVSFGGTYQQCKIVETTKVGSLTVHTKTREHREDRLSTGLVSR